MGPYCTFCGKRCFCHFPQGTPQEVLKAYGSSSIIATCERGQDFEMEKVGYCFDIIKIIIACPPILQTSAPLNFEDLAFWHQRAAKLLGQPVRIV